MGAFRKQIVASLIFSCACASLAAERAGYTITEIGGLSGTHSAKVSGINNSGQVVGTSANHAFPWEHGVMKDLGLPGETGSAHGINNRGEIVGASSAKNVRGGAVLWKNGQWQSLGDLGPSGSGSTAISINDKGEVVGVSSGFATNRGVVRAVVWQGGVIRDLGTLGGLHSTANGLNARGEVIGWSEIGDQSTVAFLWQNGVMRDLGSLPGSTAQPGTGSQANALNETDQVVGSSLNFRGEMRAVIWENRRILDLNQLIPRVAGRVMTRATAINNRGQIAVEQQTGADGAAKSYLLTPRHLSRDSEP
jgi:probable HAF family extracellular repeat protein